MEEGSGCFMVIRFCKDHIFYSFLGNHIQIYNSSRWAQYVSSFMIFSNHIICQMLKYVTLKGVQYVLSMIFNVIIILPK